MPSLVRLVASLAAAVLALVASAGAQIHYPDFRSTEGLLFAGTAERNDSIVDLNGIGPKLAGAVWHVQKQPVARGFITTFVFQVSDTSGQFDAGGAKGGDGIAFVIQNATPAPVGGHGGLLGYDGIRNSIAIEFDTYKNDEPGFDDPNGNHVSVQTTGIGTNSASHSYSIGSALNIPNLSDGRPHTVTIEYVNKALRVYLDGCQGIILAMPLDIENRIRLDNGEAWVGFTAATGSAWERHILSSWTFNGRPLPQAKRVSMCEGSSARLALPGRFRTYRWSTGATTPAIDVTRPGRYSVTVEDTIPCSPDEFDFVYDVVQSAAPRPRIATVDTLRLCTGDQLILDAGPYTTWMWSTGLASRQLVVTTPGRYWVQVTDSLGCVGWDTITVVPAVRPVPRVTVTGPTRFCSGDSVLLDAGEGHASYRWSTGATTRSIVVRGAGTFTVTVTNALGCPATSDPIAVTVLPRPYPVIAPSGPTAFCRGGSVTLDAGSGYASYLWSNGATSRTIDVDTAGVFTVIVSGANGCVGSSSPLRVVVGDPPTPEIIASPAASLCTGDTVTLRTRAPYARYRWSNGATTSTIIVTESGMFTVEVVDSLGCAGTSEPFAVRLDSLGVLRLETSGPTDLCEGDTVTISAPEGLARYRWSTGDTSSSIVVSRAGTYALDATDSAGCSASTTIAIRVFEQPVAVAGPDTTICAGEFVRLVAAPVEGTYAWTPSEGLGCADCATPIASPATTTRYRLVVTSPGGCSDTAYVQVDVLPAPRAIVRVVGDERVFPGQPVEMPVVVDGPIDEAAVSDFTIDLDYDTSIMLLRGIVLEGAMLTGWQMEPLVDSAGHFRARFRSDGTQTLAGGTEILTMRMQTFLGAPQRAEIRPTLTLENRACANVAGTAGSVTIDSVCGIPGRLIEALSGANLLRAASPNPFGDRTELALSLASTAIARVEIVAPDGTVVALLHDGLLDAGDHRFAWDASDAASGVYLARVVAGDWSDTRQLLLVR